MLDNNQWLGLGVIAGIAYLVDSGYRGGEGYGAESFEAEDFTTLPKPNDDIYYKYGDLICLNCGTTKIENLRGRGKKFCDRWSEKPRGECASKPESVRVIDRDRRNLIRKINEAIYGRNDAESFEAKEGNYKLGNYADYEILELDTHSYLMSVGHSESEAEDLIERYEAFIEVGFENGDSPYEIGISITENERLDNEAESFDAEEIPMPKLVGWEESEEVGGHYGALGRPIITVQHTIIGPRGGKTVEEVIYEANAVNWSGVRNAESFEAEEWDFGDDREALRKGDEHSDFNNAWRWIFKTKRREWPKWGQKFYDKYKWTLDDPHWNPQLDAESFEADDCEGCGLPDDGKCDCTIDLEYCTTCDEDVGSKNLRKCNCGGAVCKDCNYCEMCGNNLDAESFEAESGKGYKVVLRETADAPYLIRVDMGNEEKKNKGGMGPFGGSAMASMTQQNLKGIMLDEEQARYRSITFQDLAELNEKDRTLFLETYFDSITGRLDEARKILASEEKSGDGV